ncbi:MAG: hypothetical protein KDI19_12970, partial [Pseudomonadales bacterium]|nr:hypothetical protein [Pseudomonadales bacterium]
MSQYAALHDRWSRIYDLKHVQAISSWDEASMMPVGGGDARGRAMSTLAVIIHEMTVARDMHGMIARARAEKLDDWQAANVREIERVVTTATALPAELVEKIGLATSRSEQAWRRYRAENNFSAMMPLLDEVIRLMRQKANVMANATGLSPYDALLDEYEPGMRTSKLDELFADLKDFLPGFIA